MNNRALALSVTVLAVSACVLLSQPASPSQPPARPPMPPAVPSPVPATVPHAAPAPAQPPAAVSTPVQAQVPVQVPAPATSSNGAKITFETPVYDFGKVRSGEPVKYSYVFTNTGDQTLYLTNVQPQCGCTAMGDWTRQVEPGKTGSIAVQFNSANFNGQVFKTVTVFSNDKQQPTLMLQLKGTVWKPVDVAPQFAVLNVPPDARSASTQVRIVNNTDEPISVQAPESNNRSFTATITTNQPGKEFLLTVSALPPLNPGNVQGQITVKTSSTNAPVVTVTVWANVQPAVSVMPPQITLPPAPMSSQITPIVTIQNNSTNPLTLSNPVINLAGVDVQLKETVPGRTYAATLVFPQATQLPPGQPISFTINTSSAQTPQIKVPVFQMPKPVVPTAAPPPQSFGAPVRIAPPPTAPPAPAPAPAPAAPTS